MSGVAVVGRVVSRDRDRMSGVVFLLAGPVHAQMLGVDLGRLLPQRKTEDPGQISLAGIPDLVAGTGFEPVASGL